MILFSLEYFSCYFDKTPGHQFIETVFLSILQFDCQCTMSASLIFFFSQLNLLEILTIFGGSIVISLRLLHAWVAFQLYLTVPYIWRVWKFVKFGIFEIIQLRIYLSSEVVPLCWPVSWMRSGLFPLLWTLSLSLSSFRRVLWGSDARTNLAFCLLDLEQRALSTRAMRMIMRTKTEMMARNIQTSGVTLRAWARLGLDLLSLSISLF